MPFSWRLQNSCWTGALTIWLASWAIGAIHLDGTIQSLCADLKGFTTRPLSSRRKCVGHVEKRRVKLHMDGAFLPMVRKVRLEPQYCLGTQNGLCFEITGTKGP